MKLRDNLWELRLSLFLVLASLLIFLLKILIIGDDGESNTLSYIFNALGFLPINVLLVTLILNSLLARRAKREQQEKMKMIVGLFFSELGTTMLHMIVGCDTRVETVRTNLAVQMTWKPAEYRAAAEFLKTYAPDLVPDTGALAAIRTELAGKHEFLLGLVENPVFLEGEKVADLMQALFHLSEELCDRGNLAELPASDLRHLTGDLTRVYVPLAELWLSHMEYLSARYPYLLSLSLRKSPFREQRDVVVRS